MNTLPPPTGKIGSLRDSNLELLRIVSMLLIVLSHSSCHSGANPLVGDMFMFGGGVGVNCFILISGYFMIKSRVTLARMLKLWFQVIFYSAGIYLVLKAFGFSVAGQLLKSLLPVLMNSYWFITSYIILMLLSPFINDYLLKLNRKSYLNFLGALGIVTIIIPNIFLSFGVTEKVGLFVFLYSLAAFVRLHVNIAEIKRKYWLLIGGCTLLFMEGSIPTVHYLSEISGIQMSGRIVGGLIANPNGTLPLIFSFSLFMIFTSLRIGSRPWINAIAAGAFGVYLIHDNIIMRPIIWHNVFDVSRLNGSPLIQAGYCIGISLLVYMACSLIDMLRNLTIGRLYDYLAPRLILPIAHKILRKAKRLFEKKLKIY